MLMILKISVSFLISSKDDVSAMFLLFSEICLSILQSTPSVAAVDRR